MPPEITIPYLQKIIDSLAQCRALGIHVREITSGRVTLELPYDEKIVGNPVSRVIHGGALTTLLDTNCGMSLVARLGQIVIAPTLDLRIDYMTTAKPDMPVYSHAEVFRDTKNVIFCRGIAYQDEIEKPIAHCVATFMRLDKETLQNSNAVN